MLARRQSVGQVAASKASSARRLITRWRSASDWQMAERWRVWAISVRLSWEKRSSTARRCAAVRETASRLARAWLSVAARGLGGGAGLAARRGAALERRGGGGGGGGGGCGGGLVCGRGGGGRGGVWGG